VHVLFVHKNFPAQFGHVARYLIERHGYRCTFVSELPDAEIEGIRRIGYKTKGLATAQTHYCSRTFENYVWHSHAVYETLKSHPEVRPDLVVGHSGFGSTVFLRDLYECPIINYFEWYYRAVGSDMDFRTEFPVLELNRLRARTRNAMLLLDLQTCTLGYSPTDWQRTRLPREYQYKLSTIFDGIDTTLWRPNGTAHGASSGTLTDRTVGRRTIPAGMRIVTYVSRGFESMRGFDIFMRVAKRIYERRGDVVFVCVGSDRVCYGGDTNHIEEKSFRHHVLAQEKYDLDRFIFTGQVAPAELARIFNTSDLHIYLTVPFVLSWSMMNALACGCTVLASATPPVMEMIEHERNGLLADFFDVDRFVELALAVLDDPAAYRRLGQAGAAMIRERYSVDVCLPRMVELYQRAAREHRKASESPVER
jgi:glycosyltransferase involved in cell wall biosynthesis